MNANTTLSSATRIPQNAAIRRCCLAEKRSRRDSSLKHLGLVETTVFADQAYRRPCLSWWVTKTSATS
jgi:hypothetical protein